MAEGKVLSHAQSSDWKEASIKGIDWVRDQKRDEREIHTLGMCWGSTEWGLYYRLPVCEALFWVLAREYGSSDRPVLAGYPHWELCCAVDYWPKLSVLGA